MCASKLGLLVMTHTTQPYPLYHGGTITGSVEPAMVGYYFRTKHSQWGEQQSFWFPDRDSAMLALDKWEHIQQGHQIRIGKQ